MSTTPSLHRKNISQTESEIDAENASKPSKKSTVDIGLDSQCTVLEGVAERLMLVHKPGYVMDARHSEAMTINKFIIEHADRTFIVVYDTFNPNKALPPAVDYIVGGFTMGLNLGADFVPQFTSIEGCNAKAVFFKEPVSEDTEAGKTLTSSGVHILTSSNLVLTVVLYSPGVTTYALPFPISRNLASATTYFYIQGSGAMKATANMAVFLGTILDKAGYDCLVAYRASRTGPWVIFGAGSAVLGTPTAIFGTEFMAEFPGLKRMLRCGMCGVGKPRHSIEACPLFPYAEKARGPAMLPIKSGPKDVLTWIDTRVPDLDVQETLRSLQADLIKQIAFSQDLADRLAALEISASSSDIVEVPAAPATPVPVKKSKKKAVKKE